MISRKARLRRPVSVVIYWRESHLVFENYFAGTCITADPQTTAVLDFFGRWRTSSEFHSKFRTYERASLVRALRQLRQRHFLLREGSVEARLDERFRRAWSPWLPAAGMLQFSTRKVDYESNLAAAWREFRERAKRIPASSPVKHYPQAPQVSLPAPRKDGTLPQILLKRRTWRRFSLRPIKLAELATLLALTWGVQRWVRFPGIARLALKTSPSAGARHPIEVYVLAVRVEGLPSGFYHYAADRHRLERLSRNSSPRIAVGYLANQWWYAPAAALMFMTAVFSRNQWKYQDSAAYRTVMLDAGHLCQTFCLVATWLGLAPFCTMAFDQTRVEKGLAIDGIKESVIYAAGVGSRPRGVSWAPWPRPRNWPGIISG